MLLILLASLTLAAWGKPTSGNWNPMINQGLFEGDIMGIDPTDRNAVARDSQRWPGAIVPYVIDQSLSPLSNEIQRAMQHIQLNSCIRFVPRTNHRDFVRLYKGEGCWSYWGFLGRGQQDLSLGVGCEPFGTIVHELLHAIGFEHEHNRSDRDDHLIINWDNIEKEWFYAFKKLKPEENRLLSAFDFDSIMLYGQTSFAKAHNLKSMEARNGRFMPEVYDKKSLSANDVYRIKELYNC